jgi:ABC-2 type transport system ATP-binding protein
MKQRLMIAIALIGDPKLLILDEPMNGLDPLGIKEIRDLLLYLNKEKKITIVISSHILEELSKIATCYGVIQQGKLIEEFAAAELEKSGRKFLEISVDDTNAALDLLKRNGFSGGDVVGGDNHIELAGHFDEGAEIIDLLVRKGIRVNYLARKEDSLEGYFMNLIGGNKQ